MKIQLFRHLLFPLAAAGWLVSTSALHAQFAASADINGSAPAGTFLANGGGSFSVTGGGGDIWDTSDQFFFAHSPVTGDFDVEVRVESVTPQNRWAKFGLMLRETLAPDSRMAFMRVTHNQAASNDGSGAGANDSRFAYRTGLINVAGPNGGQHEDGTAIPSFPNAWLRLTRQGSVLRGYASSDGVNWALQGIQDTAGWQGGALPATCQLGFAVTSHSQGNPATAEFREYNLPVGITGRKFNNTGGGVAVPDLTGHANFPHGADATFNLGLFEDPSASDGAGNNENYGFQLYGVYVPPSSGLHTFYISADDGAACYLSSDDQPVNRQEICREPAWNGAREYISGSNQGSRGSPAANVSAPIYLIAGKRYYLEALMKEGGGGNNLSVAVAEPGGPGVANGSSPIPAARFTPARRYGDTICDTIYYNEGPRVITSGPVATTVSQNQTATFRVTVDGTPPYSFQWRRDGNPIGGANGPTYTTPATTVAGDDGHVYSVEVGNAFGTITSGNATLTVLGDTCLAGVLRREIWDRIDPFDGPIDNTLNGLTSRVRYQLNQPDIVDHLTSFNSPMRADRYGVRVTGFIRPTETAIYTFQLHSDDASGIRLSSDANPANAQVLVEEPGCCGFLHSAPIQLVAGNSYYVEGLMKEGGGGDYLELFWKNNASIGAFTIIPAANLAYCAVDATGPTPISAASIDGTAVGVCFNEDLDVITATSPASYLINGSPPIALLLQANRKEVLLLAAAPLGPVGSTFTVSVQGVRDIFGNAMAAPVALTGRYWANHQDIGGPAPGGNAYSCREGDVTVTAGGADIWDAADQFHFVHQQKTGNFDVAVRVERLDPMNRWSKGGLMARESLDANSRTLQIVTTPLATDVAEIETGIRGSTGGGTGGWEAIARPPLNRPNLWVRLNRVGNTFSCYYGTDGNSWTQFGQTSPSFPTTVYVGLAQTSHNNGNAGTGEYRDFFALPPPVITMQPAGANKQECESMTFSVMATGDPRATPLTYQWRKNGVDIPGATSDTYTIPSLIGTDAGGYDVLVSNSGGHALSSTVALAVRLAPKLLAASSRGNPDGIYLFFSENVDPGLALNSASYMVAARTVDTAQYIPLLAPNGPRSAVLLTVSPPLTPGAAYAVQINGLLDEDAPQNVLCPNPTVATVVHGDSACGFQSNNFENALPAGSGLFGTAVIEGGILKLTKNLNGQLGSFVINNFNDGKPVGGFTATFKALVGGGTAPAADGFSFSFGPDVPYGLIGGGEEGEGSGLRVAFDSFDNAGGEAPAIDVYWNNAVIGHFLTPVSQGPAGNSFFDVFIKMDPDGTLDVRYNNFPIYSDFPTPWAPTAGNVGFSARTGGLNDNHWIDDLDLRVTGVTPALGPVVIDTPPLDQTICLGQSATFSAAYSGAPCLFAQWYSNGIALPGATNLALVISATDPSAAGAIIKLVVTNEFSMAMASATLTLKQDFGDAPPSYPTLLAHNGARHFLVPGGPTLGPNIDAESDGQPHPLALADDGNGSPDDEDGVFIPSSPLLGQTMPITIDAPLGGIIDGWMDFDADGNWSDPGEQILTSVALIPGLNFLTFNVPAQATLGPAQARFRISTAGGLSYVGAALDGEVEDHVAEILAAVDVSVSVTGAPQPVPAGGSLTYTVTLSNAGPSTATSVELVDSLPPGTTFVSASPGCVHALGTVTCNLASLAPGAATILSIVVAPPPVCQGGLANRADVSANESDVQVGNNSAVTANTLADLSPPQITACAPPQMLMGFTGCQALLPDYTSLVTATDCSPPILVTQNPAPGTSLPLGIHTVTFTVADAHNLSTTCTAVVTVSDVLLFDNFNAATGNTTDLNIDLARQTGRLAPVSYTLAGGPGHYAHQLQNVNAPNQVLLADFGNSTTSPNFNFNGVNSAGGLRISFDLDSNPTVYGSGDQSLWGCLNLGMSAADQLANVNQNAPHFGVLFRANGSLQAFDGAAVVSPGPEPIYSTQPPGTTNHIEIVLTDADGNPFDGTGNTTIEIFANGATLPAFTFTKAGGYADNYINLQGLFRSHVDNLRITRLPIGAAPTIANPSFEANTYTAWPGYAGQLGNGPITGWTAEGGHGLNPVAPFGPTDSPFADNGAIPHGVQVAFMQQDGALRQTLTGFTPGASYQVRYFENARSGATAPACEVTIGGVTIVASHIVTPVGGANPYREVISAPFTATAGTMELAFLKSNPQGGDTTLLIDNVSVIPPTLGPVFITQPQSQFVVLGGTVSLHSCAISGTPLTYQWYHNGSAVPGANSPSLTFVASSLAAGGDYTVVVNGPATTSQVAVVTVAAPVPGLFNTGVDDNGLALPDNAIDPHYTLIVNADSASSDAIVQQSDAFPIAFGPWLANAADSKWIGPRFNTAGAAGLAQGGGIYVYRLVFDLTGLDRNAVRITGRWGVDNDGLSIRVNGAPTGVVNVNGFVALTPFTIDNGNATFVDGLNTLDFEVRNVDAISGYTGLRVADLQGLAGIVPPAITVQPASHLATIGQPTTFSVTAIGAFLSYQWRFQGSPIPGATGASYTDNNVQPGDAGNYDVVVTNPAGMVTSDPATLTLNRPPVAGDDGAATTEGRAVRIAKAKLLSNDSDPDGDSVAVASVSPFSVNGGTVTNEAGHVLYTPPPGFFGTDRFTYTISDGRGGFDTADVFIFVADGDLPSLNRVSITVASGGVRVRFAGIPGRAYLLQRADSPMGPWIDLAPLTTPPHGIMEFIDLMPLPMSFYRTALP